MGTSAIQTLIRVYRLGRAMHPTFALNSIKHQIILLGQALVYLPYIRKWYDISDNPLLALALKRFPLISGAIYWPYINHSWSMERRLDVIGQHFRMLVGPATIIAHATFENVELVRLDKEYAGLHQVLDKAEGFYVKVK